MSLSVLLPVVGLSYSPRATGCCQSTNVQADSAFIAAQEIGKVPSFCELGSDFITNFQACVACYSVEDVDIPSTGIGELMEYCVELRVQTTLMGNGKEVNSTINTTGPEEETSDSSNQPLAWIVGAMVGAITQIALVAGGIYYFRRWKRARRAGATATLNDGDTEAASGKAQLHSECVGRALACELEGSTPAPISEFPAIVPAEMEVNEIAACEKGIEEEVCEAKRQKSVQIIVVKDERLRMNSE